MLPRAPAIVGSMETADAVGAVCVPNISTRERQKRLMAGGVQAAVALVVLAVLPAMRANRWWRLAPFPIFGGAAAGYFQWQDRT